MAKLFLGVNVIKKGIPGKTENKYISKTIDPSYAKAGHESTAPEFARAPTISTGSEGIRSA